MYACVYACIYKTWCIIVNGLQPRYCRRNRTELFADRSPSFREKPSISLQCKRDRRRPWGGMGGMRMMKRWQPWSYRNVKDRWHDNCTLRLKLNKPFLGSVCPVEENRAEPVRWRVPPVHSWQCVEFNTAAATIGIWSIAWLTATEERCKDSRMTGLGIDRMSRFPNRLQIGMHTDRTYRLIDSQLYTMSFTKPVHGSWDYKDAHIGADSRTSRFKMEGRQLNVHGIDCR